MPAQICHSLAGRMALETSGIALEGFVLPAFNLGCQGPDIFSHNRITKPFALALSRMLHRGSYGSFCGNVARGLLASPRESAAMSWFLGFVTHQETDRALHPYIVNRSYLVEPIGLSGVSPALVHAFFERILDARLYLSLERRPVSSFDTGVPFSLDMRSRESIAHLISRALVVTYPGQPVDDELDRRIMNAFEDSISFYAATNPARTGMSGLDGRRETPYGAIDASMVALLYPERADSGVDWLNEARLPWKNPADGLPRSESAIDLFRRAVSRSSAIIALVDRVLSGTVTERDGTPSVAGPDAIAREIGDSCLSIAGPDGKVTGVVASEPFDLIGALTREVSYRTRSVS